MTAVARATIEQSRFSTALTQAIAMRELVKRAGKLQAVFTSDKLLPPAEAKAVVTIRELGIVAQFGEPGGIRELIVFPELQEGDSENRLGAYRLSWYPNGSRVIQYFAHDGTSYIVGEKRGDEIVHDLRSRLSTEEHTTRDFTQFFRETETIGSFRLQQLLDQVKQMQENYPKGVQLRPEQLKQAFAIGQTNEGLFILSKDVKKGGTIHKITIFSTTKKAYAIKIAWSKEGREKIEIYVPQGKSHPSIAGLSDAYDRTIEDLYAFRDSPMVGTRQMREQVGTFLNAIFQLKSTDYRRVRRNNLLAA